MHTLILSKLKTQVNENHTILLSGMHTIQSLDLSIAKGTYILT